jgi:hypothetical protein
MRQIFIIGCAKTGSKMIGKVLMASPNLGLLNELHYLVPRWAKKDFVHHAREVGDLKIDANVGKLVELMFSKKPRGSFWQKVDHLSTDAMLGKISDFDPQRLEERIFESDRSDGAIMRILVEDYAAIRGKSITGAKFPVNIVYVDDLVEWFPGCKLIHLVRDPRAIYVSMVNTSMRGVTSLVWARKFVMQFVKFIYVCHQYRAALAVHRKYQSSPDYCCVKFEDMIENSENEVRQLCTFCDIEFSSEMLSPPTGVGSFYGKEVEQNRGFDKQTIDRWKARIPAFYRKLLEGVLRKEIQAFGYV